ncbi:MAG: hypothetical protein LC655_05895, partial [Bacteroidales bacterium]|nr:hypothetical protein [Bacteroidales bacterium]
SDESGNWSSTLSRFFYKMPVSPVTENKMTRYQYWFNNDLEDAVTGTTTNAGLIQLDETLDVAGLPSGLHAFHIRFSDESGKWSSTLSRFFYKMPVQETLEENLVSAYRYWFNEDDSRVFNIGLDVPVNPLHLLADIETPYLEPGEHTLHIQFLDLRGRWSSALSENFETEDCVPPGYIDDPAGAVELCRGTSEQYTVQSALNIEDFEWSLTPAGAGSLVPDGSSLTVNWSEGFTGDAELTVYGINPCGESETRSLTVTVVSDPYVTAMDDTSVCEGESVVLEVLSSYGNVEWNIADLTVSPTEETTYTVTSSNLCGVANDQVIIGVDTTPNLTVMDDQTICEGEEVELTAVSDGTVTWSGGSNIVSPSETTGYTATASNSCGTVDADVQVVVKPLPSLEVMQGPEICEGEELLLEAESDGIITWSSGSELVTPVESITYTAFAEKDGCEVQEDLYVKVHPVPETPVLEQVEETLVSGSESGNIWFFNDEELEGFSGHQYSPEATGDYFVRVISTEGCISGASNIISYISTGNLINIGMNEITVFP